MISSAVAIDVVESVSIKGEMDNFTTDLFKTVSTRIIEKTNKLKSYVVSRDLPMVMKSILPHLLTTG